MRQLPQIAAQLEKLHQDVEITRAKLASLMVRAPVAGRMTAIDSKSARTATAASGWASSRPNPASKWWRPSTSTTWAACAPGKPRPVRSRAASCRSPSTRLSAGARRHFHRRSRVRGDAADGLAAGPGDAGKVLAGTATAASAAGRRLPAAERRRLGIRARRRTATRPPPAHPRRPAQHRAARDPRRPHARRTRDHLRLHAATTASTASTFSEESFMLKLDRDRQGLSHHRGGDPGANDVSSADRRGRVRRHHGPVGLRQVDAAQHPRPARQPDARAPTASSARTCPAIFGGAAHRRCAAPHRLRLPELQPDRRPDGGRERRGGAALSRRARRASAAPRGRGAGARRHRASRAPPAAAALRRPAAARRGGPRAGVRAAS